MRDPRVGLALAAVALFLVLATHRNYGGWNDTSRLGMVEALVEHGRLWLDGTAIGRKSGDVCMIDGHYYSDKPPAVALLAVPAYATLHALGVTFARDLPRAYYWTTLLTIGLTTMLGLVMLAWFLQALGIDARWRALTVLGVGLGSLNTAFSVTFSNHPPSGMLLLAGVLLIWRWRRFGAGIWTLAAGGFLVGVAATADHGAAFYLPFLLAYVAWPGSRDAMRGATALVLAGGVPLVAYMVYAYVLSGSPLPLPLQPRLFEYPGSYFSRSAGHLPGSSFAHDSIGDLLAYAWLCFFGERGLFSHTPIVLFLVFGMVRLAFLPRHPHRAEAITILLGTAVLVLYYLLSSDNPGGNSYGVRWYCLFIPLCFVFLADAYALLATRVARVGFWIAYALSFPLAWIGALDPWLDPTPYGHGFSWVIVLRAHGLF